MTEGQANDGERRERRSRDRYGRDRRGDRPGRDGQMSVIADTEGSTTPIENNLAPSSASKEPAVRQPMPKVHSYELPVASLQSVAQSAQLDWVQSDPVRVAEVQAAIAAEPKPIHVPRERPPLAVLDDGPLILVETRKDLGQMKMPFEA